ncbi:MAG TPA: MATE family efflux transporter [Bacillota bacterium]|nr:MATE family efflux transporter [Bacillota bacterium]
MINFIRAAFDRDKQMRREIIALTFPVFTEQACITLMDVVNAMMAGHIGKEATAAIGIVDTLNIIFIALFSALAVGGTVVVAHCMGQGNPRNANDSVKQALYSGVFLAILITISLDIFRYPLIKLLYSTADSQVRNYALSYLRITLLTYPLIALTSISCGVLRGAGDTKTPAKIVLLMNFINICFSFILIFGIHLNMSFIRVQFGGLGVIGAALGIAIARTSGALVSLYVLIQGSWGLKLRRIFHFTPNFELLNSILKIGLPACLESLLFNAGKLITQTFIVSLGTVPIVVNYIGNSLHGLMCVPGNAIGISSTAIIGRYMGRGERDTARKYLAYLHKLGVICFFGVNLSLVWFFPFLVSLYTPNPDIINSTSFVLRSVLFFAPFWAFSFILPAGLKGAGDVKYTLTVSACSMWLCRITFGYILGVYFKLGVLGIWLAMYTDWIIRSIAFYLRFKSNLWQEHVVVKNNISCAESKG